MTTKQIDTTELRRSADEVAWRDSWYAHVMIETGRERGPVKKMPVQEHGSRADL
jgi:hypothetical protein